MMVPLRRALIEKEHGVLPYPEGTACADVLVAGERGGALARTVFMGLGTGAIWKSLSWIFQIFPTAIGYTVARTGVFPNATLNLDLSPEYMGVGYVIGPRIAGVMFAGGVLSWLVSAAAAVDSRQLHDRTVPAGAGERSADRSDVGATTVERVHPLHRRWRGARRRPDHARADAADDRRRRSARA